MKKTVLFSAALLTAGTAFSAVQTAATAARIAGNGLQPVRMEQNFQKDKVMKAVQLDKSMIVATKQLKNGNSISLVRGNDGQLHKVLNLKATDKITAKANKATLKAQKSAENATYFEGFEGYDGKSRGWIPEGWEQVSKTDPAHVSPTGDGTSLVWEATSGDGFQGAFDGNYCERIQVSMFDFTDDGDIIFAEQQDEWLITPAVTPKSGDYLAFQLQYSPAFTLLDANTMEYTAENNTLEVLVSTDNGANWEKVWDALDDAHGYSEAELDADASSYVRPFRQMVVNMSKYAGKSVKIAFRYVGIDGESMMLDNVELTSDVQPAVSMEAPGATFPIGYSIEGYGLSNNGQPLNLALAPYQTELTWINTSRPFETNTWTFPDEDGNETSVSTKNLEAPAYDFGQFAAPSLTTAIGSNTTEPLSMFDEIQYGGAVMARDNQGNYINFTPAMYSRKQLTDGKARISRAAQGIFGMGSESDETWTDLMQSNYKVKGVGYAIPQPAAPYVVSGVFTAVYGETLTNKSTLTATLYKQEEGQLIEVAKGYCSPSEFYQADAQSWPMAQFLFEQDIDGLPTQAPVMVDYPAVILFSAELANGESFDFAGTFDSDPQADSNAYVFLENEDGRLRMVATDALGFTTTDGTSMVYNGLFGGFDATYSWLLSDEDSFEANPAGESKTFDVDCYYNLVDSNGEDLATAEGEGLGDWYTVAFANGSEDEDAAITVTVDALPAGVDVRSGSFTVDVFGIKKTFWVAQRSEAGVSAVAASASKASLNGNVIEVASQKATKVAVYNVAGQKVAEKSFAGNAVIPAADLQKGVYFVKFNDNTVVKLAK